MLRSLATAATLALSSSALAGTITATFGGTLSNWQIDGVSQANATSFTLTVSFDDSIYADESGYRSFRSVSSASMDISGVGDLDLATDSTGLSAVQVRLSDGLRIRFRTGFNGTGGVTHFLPASTTPWYDSTSGFDTDWAATSVSGSGSVSNKTFASSGGTLKFVSNSFNWNSAAASSGSTPAVPGVGALAGLAGIGLAGRRRRR
jgi:hypothetical protein